MEEYKQLSFEDFHEDDKELVGEYNSIADKIQQTANVFYAIEDYKEKAFNEGFLSEESLVEMKEVVQDHTDIIQVGSFEDFDTIKEKAKELYEYILSLIKLLIEKAKELAKSAKLRAIALGTKIVKLKDKVKQSMAPNVKRTIKPDEFTSLWHKDTFMGMEDPSGRFLRLTTKPYDEARQNMSIIAKAGSDIIYKRLDSLPGRIPSKDDLAKDVTQGFFLKSVKEVPILGKATEEAELNKGIGEIEESDLYKNKANNLKFSHFWWTGSFNPVVVRIDFAKKSNSVKLNGVSAVVKQFQSNDTTNAKPVEISVKKEEVLSRIETIEGFVKNLSLTVDKKIDQVLETVQEEIRLQGKKMQSPKFHNMQAPKSIADMVMSIQTFLIDYAKKVIDILQYVGRYILAQSGHYLTFYNSLVETGGENAT